MKAFRGFIAGLCLGFTAAVLPGCQGTRAACGPDSCADGCCTEDGACLSGGRDVACGYGGETCNVCEGVQTCDARQCVTVDPAADVFGRGSNRYTTEAGVVTRVINYAQTDVAALVSSEDGYRVLEGTGTLDGAVRVKGVPEEPVLLQLGSTYVSTSARTLRLGAPKLGRAEAFAASNPTPLAFDVQGLSAWSSEDELQLFSMNGGFLVPDLESRLSATPPDGSTSLQASTDVQRLPGYRLLDSRQGDALWLTQLEAQGTGSRGLTRAVRFDSLRQADAVTGTAVGTLAEVPLRPDEAVTLRLPLFEAMRSAVNPAATFVAHRLLTSVHPAGWGSPGADLALVAASSRASDVTVTLRYGNPFPAAWPVIRSLTTYFEMKYALPGGTALSRYPVVSRAAAAEQFASGPVVPSLSPARELRVDAGVMSWLPPATGTPTGYEVLVYRLGVENGATVDAFVASFLVPGSPLRLPDGLLQAGATYYVRLRAVSRPGDEAAPFEPSLPESIAETFSHSFGPG